MIGIPSSAMRRSLLLVAAFLMLSGISLFLFYPAPEPQPMTHTEKKAASKKGRIPLKDRIDLAIIQEAEKTKDPATNTVPRERLKQAYEYAELLRSRAVNNRMAGAIPGMNWVERGPKNVGMGLLLIKEGTSNIISNNKTIPEYLELFEERYSNQLDILERLYQIAIPTVFKTKHLQNAIILNLDKYGEPERFYTTTEISHLINKNPDFESHQKHKDNISRYFNQKFHPYFEIKHFEGRSSFRLSQTGKAYARWLIRNKMD